MNRTKIAAMLSLAMVASSVMPVLADDEVKTNLTNSTQSITYYGDNSDAITQETTEKTHQVDVSVTVGSTYTVVIPKTIVISGSDKYADYTLKVYGDIAGTERINVVPPTSFKLTQIGKPDVTATISQAVQKFRAANTDEKTAKGFSTDTILMSAAAPEADSTVGVTTGTIYANGRKETGKEAGTITAGAWKGTFNFIVSVTADDADDVTNPSTDATSSTDTTNPSGEAGSDGTT